MHVSFIADTHTAPLNLLALSQQNVRTNAEDTTALADLKASIMAHGLINPLVVTKAKRGKKMNVVAGGRRYRALSELASEGNIPADFEVSVQVVAEGDAEEISLVENFVRTQLRPYEIYRAFKQVQHAHKDVTIEDLADRFGMKPDRAARILRLGNLLPDIFEMYAKGEIDDAQAQAFAATDSHMRQAVALETWKNADQWNRNAQAIRKFIGMDDWNTKRLLDAVGVEAYEAAGGTIERDLFSNAVRIVNPELLEDLMVAKKQELLAEVAKHAKVPVTLISEKPKHKDGYTDYRREIRPTAVPFTDEQANRLAELEAIMEDTGHGSAEYEAAEAEYDAITEGQDYTLPDDAGEILVVIEDNGTATFWRAGAEPEKPKLAGTSEDEGGPAKPSAKAIDEMGKMRRLRMRDIAVEDPIAVDGLHYLAFMIARQACGGLKLDGVEWSQTIFDCSFAEEEWMREENLTLAFANFYQDNPRKVAMEIAALMARPSVTPKKPGFTEWLASQTEPVAFKSSPEFWALFRKGQIIAMVEEFSSELASIIRNMKQGDMRRHVHDFLTCVDKPAFKAIPSEQVEAGKQWVPTWLRLTTD